MLKTILKLPVRLLKLIRTLISNLTIRGRLRRKYRYQISLLVKLNRYTVSAYKSATNIQGFYMDLQSFYLHQFRVAAKLLDRDDIFNVSTVIDKTSA